MISAHDQDGPPDSTAILDQQPSDNTKRAKWWRAGRKIGRVVLGVLELIGGLLP